MIPLAAPLMATDTPLNSIGSVKLREREPTAVCDTTVVPDVKLAIASIPGDTPKTAGGVCGVGLGLGVGVVPGVGVGTGDAETGILLAPVAKLKVAVDGVAVTFGSRK